MRVDIMLAEILIFLNYTFDWKPQSLIASENLRLL